MNEEKDLEVPKQYGMTVRYASGRTTILELSQHSLKETIVCSDQAGGKFSTPAPQPFIEFVTADGIWGWIPLNNTIEEIAFDERFSKIVEVRARLAETPQPQGNRIKVVQ